MFEETLQIFNGQTTLGAIAEMCFNGNMECAVKLLASAAFQTAIAQFYSGEQSEAIIYMDDQYNFLDTPVENGRCKKLVLKVVVTDKREPIITVSDEQ
jgi:hypothetical protein